jgi:DNA-binding MarR family transcriptional regulator
VTLSRLEKLGYISRVADPDDMRALRVYLTDKGRELDRDSFRRLREADDILMKGINEEESAFLTKLLTRMRDNILDALKNGEEN